MALPLVTVFMVLFAIALFVWWLVMLVEALRIPPARWRENGHEQLVYVLLMIFLGVIGTLIYYIVPRSELLSA